MPGGSDGPTIEHSQRMLVDFPLLLPEDFELTRWHGYIRVQVRARALGVLCGRLRHRGS